MQKNGGIENRERGSIQISPALGFCLDSHYSLTVNRAKG